MPFQTNDARSFSRPPIEHIPRKPSPDSVTRSRTETYQKWIYRVFIGILLLVVVYVSYSLYQTRWVKSEERLGSDFTPSGRPIQIDVLNGCGVAGAAAKISARLRQRGFDVVETRNYKSFDIRETMVIDRVGNLSRALTVASALGVARHNVVQEINLDYFVDVTVVIGKDFESLR